MHRKIAIRASLLLAMLLVSGLPVGCGSGRLVSSAAPGSPSTGSSQVGVAANAGAIAAPTGPLGDADVRVLDRIIGEQDSSLPEASSNSISGGQ